ncbi:MAG: hypothetical protein PHX27_00185 [Candidatus ainarchaeum sp.]|nr:hypothetical protein [Candidatus ainarchaeum sp.]
MIKRNEYSAGIIGAIFGGLAFLIVKYIFSGELDFLTAILFTIAFGITHILLTKFFINKKNKK